MLRKFKINIMLILLVCSTSCFSQNEKNKAIVKSHPFSFQVKKVHQDNDVIWGMDFINQNELLYTLKKGKIVYLDITKMKSQTIQHDLNIYDKGQGGLLDIKLHPNFKNNQWVYVTYSTKIKDGSYTTALTRAQLDLKSKTLQKYEHLFMAKPYFDTSHHFGSRIVFDEKYNLYMSIGDRGQRHLAQSIDKHNGKIIRLHDDGTIPKDNPFYGNDKALPEIWTFGHRNPQGLFWDKQSQSLWSNEHGPRGGDEINHIEKKKNYGWPVITYGKEYYGPKIGEGTKKTGMEQPKYYFVPSIAPSGFLIYSGKIHQSLKGTWLSGALKLKHLNVVVSQDKKNKNEIRLFKEKYGRIRNVVESPDGMIYFSTDQGSLYSF